jgi:uncharacterized protein (TIGR02453 family)
MAEEFTGFPPEAISFLKSLDTHNNRDWFQAHKDVYEQACRQPMQALMLELEPQYGSSKISRINRDMRFARGMAPYKTYIAGGIGGSYISLSRDGLYVGAGMYKPDAAALARFRSAIDDHTSGKALVTLVTSLRHKRYDVDTHETLRSAPKGYAPDHPRIDLLRMKDIYAGKSFTPAPWLSTRKALDKITGVIDDVQPLVKWLQRHVSSGKAPVSRRARRG